MQGVEVLTAVEASAQRSREVGYDEALIELGFDPAQLRLACSREAVAWLRPLAVRPTFGELVDLIAAAELVGISAGVRLGRMFPPSETEVPE